MSVFESKLQSSKSKMEKNHIIIKELKTEESKLLEKLHNVREKIKKQNDIIAKRESRQKQLSEAVTKVSKNDLSKEAIDILQSEQSNKDKITKLEGCVNPKHLDKIKKVYRLLDHEVQSKCLREQYSDIDLKDATIVKKLEVINYIQSKIYVFLLKNRTENFMKYLINFSIDTCTGINELDTTKGLYYITPGLFTEVNVKPSNYSIIREFEHPCNIIYNRNIRFVEDFVNSDIGYLPYQKLDVATYMNILRYGCIETKPSVIIKNLEIHLKDNDFKKYWKLIEKFNRVQKVLPKIGINCFDLDSNESGSCSDTSTIEDKRIELPITCQNLLVYVNEHMEKENYNSYKYLQYMDIQSRITQEDCITLYNEFTTIKNK